MKQDSKAFYRERYLEVIPDREDPVEVVNGLAERLMKNDPEAMEIVCRVIYYKFYDLAVYYTGKSQWTSDYADVILNQACEDFFKLCVRGLKDSVLTEGVYGLLQKSVYYAYLHMINKNKKYSEKTKFEQDDSGNIDRIQAKKDREDNISVDMLEDMIEKEEDVSDRKVLDFFREALIENKEIPYQMITYCYASLLPLMFKESSDFSFKDNINHMSARGKEGSWFRNGEIGGDIGRNSSILLNWALDAMNGQTTGFLCGEFEKLYQWEPVAGKPFSWGEQFQCALKEDHEGQKIKDLVITEVFDRMRIKNWAPRIELRLYQDTRGRMCRDEKFCKAAIGRAEKIIYEQGR